MLRLLLKDRGAKAVATILIKRGYEAEPRLLRDIRASMVKDGEARPLHNAARCQEVVPIAVPEVEASRSLLRLQLTTGQHSISDPRRIADLLLDLAA
jgi:hypothetical protein